MLVQTCNKTWQQNLATKLASQSIAGDDLCGAYRATEECRYVVGETAAAARGFRLGATPTAFAARCFPSTRFPSTGVPSTAFALRTPALRLAVALRTAAAVCATLTAALFTAPGFTLVLRCTLAALGRRLRSVALTLGTWLGGLVGRRIPQALFTKLVYVMLIVLGGLFMASAF